MFFDSLREMQSNGILKEIDLDKLKAKLTSGQVSTVKLAEIRAVYDAFGGQVENRIMQQLYSKNLTKLLKRC